MADDEWTKLRELADQCDPAVLKQAITDELRENDGEMLRWLLDGLRDHSDPEVRALYERLIINPELRDLISH